jgi:hypothetical protein
MKILASTLLVSSLFSSSLYETKASKENYDAMKNRKIKCRTVCDKKLYKEQKIEDAVSFYKNSKNYKFDRNGFNSFE